MNTRFRTLVELLSIPLALIGLGYLIMSLQPFINRLPDPVLDDITPMMSVMFALIGLYHLYVAYLLVFWFSSKTVTHLAIICAFYAFIIVFIININRLPGLPLFLATLSYFITRFLLLKLVKDKPRDVDASAPTENESLPQAK